MADIQTLGSGTFSLSIMLAMIDSGQSSDDHNELVSFAQAGSLTASVVNQIVQSDDRVNAIIAKRISVTDDDGTLANRVFDFVLFPYYPLHVFGNVSTGAYKFQPQTIAVIDETVLSDAGESVPIVVTKDAADSGYILDGEYLCPPGGFFVMSSGGGSNWSPITGKTTIRVGFPLANGVGETRTFVVVMTGFAVVGT